MFEKLVSKTGVPTVIAGHSYGGVVALAMAMAGNVRAKRLVLLEPVAVGALNLGDDGDLYESTREVFDGYIAAFEAGDRRAVRTMIDYWFGPGAFATMPDSVCEYLVRETAKNVEDVRATFRLNFEPAMLQKIEMPGVVVLGENSPTATHAIGHNIARELPDGTTLELAKANHAMTSTHTREIARVIASDEDDAERVWGPPRGADQALG